MTTIRDRIAAAISNAGDYFDACLAQRNPGPSSLGSVFDDCQTRETLLAVEWQPYAHPDVAAPAVAFRADIRGTTGVVPLALLAPDTPVRLADPKGTGTVEATAMLAVVGVPVSFTTMLLGPTRDGAGETVWTLFPGEPVRPSTLPADGMDGKTITAREAVELGLHIAKVARSA